MDSTQLDSNSQKSLGADQPSQLDDHNIQEPSTPHTITCPPPTSRPSSWDLDQHNIHTNDEQAEMDPPEARTSTLTTGTNDLLDLPSLTPSKSNTSSSDSESDSTIPEGFGDEDDEASLIDSLSLLGPSDSNVNSQRLENPRTPMSSSSSLGPPASQISLSEPGPPRNTRMGRKRSLSELVALRYRGGKVESQIGEEERGLLALDLGAYINSGDPDVPVTRTLPPSGLFPTLKGLTTMNNKTNQEEDRTSELNHETLTNLAPPRSEWPFGGTGPGKTCRGFIPGRTNNSNASNEPVQNQ